MPKPLSAGQNKPKRCQSAKRLTEKKLEEPKSSNSANSKN